jgi:hypothetical protein
MAMPQNKREDIIFTIMCVMFMCTCMIMYNMFLTMGFCWEAVAAAWQAVPITAAVCFCLEFFVACPLVKKIMSKIARPWMHQEFCIVLTQFMIVTLVVILESFYGALMACGFSSEIWMYWLHHTPMNYIVALPLLILVCSPLMRFLFRLLIPVGQLKGKEKKMEQATEAC